MLLFPDSLETAEYRDWGLSLSTYLILLENIYLSNVWTKFSELTVFYCNLLVVMEAIKIYVEYVLWNLVDDLIFLYMYRIFDDIYIYIYLHYGIEDFLALLFKPPLLTKNYRYLQSMFLTYDKWCSILQWYLHYIILLFVRKKTFQGIVIKLWRKNESIKIISHDCSNRYTIQLMFGMVCPMIGDFLIRCFREIILLHCK